MHGDAVPVKLNQLQRNIELKYTIIISVCSMYVCVNETRIKCKDKITLLGNIGVLVNNQHSTPRESIRIGAKDSLKLYQEWLVWSLDVYIRHLMF